MVGHCLNRVVEDQVVDKIKENQQPGWFNLTVQFINPDYKEIADVHINRIDQLTISRDFSAHYTDALMLSLTLFPADLLKIVQAYDKLECTLTFDFVSCPYGFIIRDINPISFSFKVIIENPSDIIKRYSSVEFIKPENQPDNDYYNSIRVPLMVQLIAKSTYEKRHIGVSVANLPGQTPESLAYYLANAFKCSNVRMVQPDNQHVFENATIPMVHLSDGFDFLQERFGLYSKGIAWYFCQNENEEELLYIYPPFENAPALEDSLAEGVFHFYKFPEKSYDGSDTYTGKVENDFHCLVNRAITMQDLSETSAEDGGNAVIVTRADTSQDLGRTVREDGSFFEDNRTLMLMTPNANAVDTQMQHAVYKGAQDNVYSLMSRMIEGQCVIAELKVGGFFPFYVTPNHPCFLHYEEDDGTWSMVSGVIVGVKSELVYQGRPYHHTYMFDTQFILRLVPDKKTGNGLSSSASKFITI